MTNIRHSDSNEVKKTNITEIQHSISDQIKLHPKYIRRYHLTAILYRESWSRYMIPGTGHNGTEWGQGAA